MEFYMFQGKLPNPRRFCVKMQPADAFHNPIAQSGASHFDCLWIDLSVLVFSNMDWR
jgi:hypothetical protein